MQYHQVDSTSANPKKDLGYIHVYTGEGKGKTTAALGHMVRALGHGHEVLMIQFLKGSKDSGEYKFHVENPENFKIMQFAQPEPVDFRNPSTQDKYLVEQGMDFARQAMVNNRPDLLILDEVNPAIHHDLIDVKEIINFLDNKHQQTEVILTGKYAHPEVMDIADMVINMDPKKHYFDDEFSPRLGIEH